MMMTIFHGQYDNDDDAYEFSFDDDTDCYGCHHSHKSGEQCEWTASLYHLQLCQPRPWYGHNPSRPNNSMDTTESMVTNLKYLPGQTLVLSQTSMVFQLELNIFS